MATFNGTNGNDTLTGTADPDIFYPLMGVDTVDGLGGHDRLVVDYSSFFYDPYAGASVPQSMTTNIVSSGGSFGGAVRTTFGGQSVTLTSIEWLTLSLNPFHDVFVIDAAAIASGAVLSVDGGGGTDRFEANLSALNGVNLTVGPNGTSASFGTVTNFETFHLTLGAGADFINTGSGGDILNGGGGDDLLYGGTGQNQLRGDGGDDQLVVNHASDSVDGGTGTDMLILGWSDATRTIVTEGFTLGAAGYSGHYYETNSFGFVERSAYFTAIERFTITAGSASDFITTGAGNDWIAGRGGNDSIDVGSGNDTADGGDGDDRLSADLSSATGAVVYNLVTGSYSAPIGAFTNFEGLGTFRTGSGNDEIVTTSLQMDETLHLGAGDDKATLRNGLDVVHGGSGSDLLVVDWSGEAGTVVSEHWQGYDWGTLADGYNGILQTAGGRRINYSGIERFDITATGSVGVTIETGGGNDRIVTGTGWDRIAPGGGDDHVDGGLGTQDVVDYSQRRTGREPGTVGVIVNLSPDSYLIHAGHALAGGTVASNQAIDNMGGRDTLLGIENAEGGEQDDVLLGSAVQNSFYGWGGNDRIVGGAGSDYIDAGDGVDLVDYSAETGGGGVVVNLNEGLFVTVPGRAQSLGPGQAVDSFGNTDTLLSVEQVTTGGQADRVYGNASANLITLGAGDDEAVGFGGNDHLIGAAGNDRLFGGQGDDRLEGGDDSDSLQGEAGNDILEGGLGDDGLGGGTGDDSLDGGTGSDILNGGADSDSLTGGDGFDRLYSHVDPGAYRRPYYGNPIVEPLMDRLAQVDTLSGGAGSDLLSAGYGDNVDGGAAFDSLLISFMGAPGGVVADFRLLATQASITVGGATIQNVERIEWLEGSQYGDFLAPGDIDANFAPIYGRGGDDHIVAGYYSGDTYGGDGDDLIDLTASQYGFYHFGEGGNDTIIGGGGYERLDGGEGDDVLSGRYGYDDLIGGGGNDILDGGSFGDNLFGGSGNDILYGAGDADIVNGDDGDDIIHGDYSPVASGNVLSPSSNDDLLRGGAGMDVIHGDQGDDRIEGGADADTLHGGTGNDLIDGGTGDDAMAGGSDNDTYAVDSLGDTVTEAAGEGTDLVRTALATYTLAANVENLTATSDVAHDFRGNAGNNVVTGAAGNDLMRFQDGGDDTAIGGAGNDAFLFIGSLTGADVVDGGAGTDELVLQGDYSAGLTLGAVTGVELIVLVPGSDTRFGAPGTQLYSYSITTTDQNVAAGVQMNVDGNRLRAGENLVFDGSAETDGSFYVFAGKGVDTLTGGARNDAFLFRGPGNFTGADTVNGGAGFDELALRGDYTGAYAVTFGATTISGIEAIVVVSGYDLRYGKLAGDLSFDLTLNEANVQSGQVMIVDAGTLRSTEKLTFDGSAETDGGRFTMFGGKGNDVLTGGSGADSIRGGLGADVMKGNAGADTFVYRDSAESTTGSVDQLLDFLSGTDRIDLSRIDANTLVGGDQAFSWIGSNAFSGSGAAGQLRAYQDGANWFVEGDTNGDGTADLVIQLTGAATIVQGDFLP